MRGSVGEGENYKSTDRYNEEGSAAMRLPPLVFLFCVSASLREARL
jgi:hypothetical protein